MITIERDNLSLRSIWWWSDKFPMFYHLGFWSLLPRNTK